MTMTTRYRHTQPGTFTLIAMTVAAILAAWIGYLNAGATERWPAWAIAIGLAVLAGLFSSLTVEVSDEELRWHFGPGFWRYRVARGDIAGVTIVRNTWWNGFGIRMRPGFRLYNVSGFDAIELRLKSGEIRRVGTDDAQGLATALKS
jgi:hypothetical protein